MFPTSLLLVGSPHTCGYARAACSSADSSLKCTHGAVEVPVQHAPGGAECIAKRAEVRQMRQLRHTALWCLYYWYRFCLVHLLCQKLYA